ncbi:hypothetical protein DF268_04705 [Streptomyces sp. V2]|nr:hypothetical protein DF268_04705 [Streptomyces sp. V2]
MRRLISLGSLRKVIPVIASKAHDVFPTDPLTQRGFANDRFNCRQCRFVEYTTPRLPHFDRPFHSECGQREAR